MVRRASLLASRVDRRYRPRDGCADAMAPHSAYLATRERPDHPRYGCQSASARWVCAPALSGLF
jgi:hypothetical protein